MQYIDSSEDVWVCLERIFDAQTSYDGFHVRLLQTRPHKGTHAQTLQMTCCVKILPSFPKRQAASLVIFLKPEGSTNKPKTVWSPCAAEEYKLIVVSFPDPSTGKPEPGVRLIYPCFKLLKLCSYLKEYIVLLKNVWNLACSNSDLSCHLGNQCRSLYPRW